MSESPSFFTRLRQRKLVQWAIAYVAAAFAFLQGIDIIGQQFGWPDSVRRGITLALVIGFFVTLVLAWYHGERGAQRVTGTELLIIGLVLAVGGGLLWRFAAARAPDNKVSIGPGESRITERPLVIPEKSIAVLPFENLSSDKENAYFADGIQDEILTRLSKIAVLKVISRSSTQKYKSSPDNLRDVGKQLGVAHLLEGSVQKIGNAVHVNVQLIRAATDEHIWAESYNRKLDDVFAVEGEVAGAIAEQLNAKLSSSEKRELTAKLTRDPAAYDAYLRGLAFQGRVDSLSTNWLNSIRAFEEAVRLDPEFATAWAQLARQQGLVYQDFDQNPERKEAARVALAKAKELGPDLIETELASGWYHYWIESDYAAAQTEFETVRQKYPNNALACEALAGIARRQGQWEQSSRLYAQAIELDPQNVFLLADASVTDLCTRNAAAAQRHLTMARDLSPQNGTITGMLAGSYQLTGDVEKAQSILDSVQASEADQIYVNVLTFNAILLRKYEPAIAVLKSQLEKPQSLGPSLGIMENALADLQRHAGDMAAATATYRQAREHLAEVLRAQPAYADILNSLAWSEAWLGDKPDALEHVRKAIATVPASRDAYVGPGYEDNLARIEAHFGDKDAAITALQHLLTIAYNFPPVTPALLQLDPDWDNLRGDPRFEELCQEKKR